MLPEDGPSARLREAVRRRAFPSQPQPDALAAARAIAECGGGSVRGVVFFGSRKTQASPGPASAYDFFVLTRDYRGFYRGLAASGRLRRSRPTRSRSASLAPAAGRSTRNAR